MIKTHAYIVPMAPRGRPPAEHVFADGQWLHVETGQPFDEKTHAALKRDKKRACRQAAYWERGGRQKRLERYERKREKRAMQLTLWDVAGQHCATTDAKCDNRQTRSCAASP